MIMPTIFVKDLTVEEKKILDVAKAKSDARTWKELFLMLVRESKDLL